MTTPTLYNVRKVNFSGELPDALTDAAHYVRALEIKGEYIIHDITMTETESRYTVTIYFEQS